MAPTRRPLQRTYSSDTPPASPHVLTPPPSGTPSHSPSTTPTPTLSSTPTLAATSLLVASPSTHSLTLHPPSPTSPLLALTAPTSPTTPNTHSPVLAPPSFSGPSVTPLSAPPAPLTRQPAPKSAYATHTPGRQLPSQRRHYHLSFTSDDDEHGDIDDGISYASRTADADGDGYRYSRHSRPYFPRTSTATLPPPRPFTSRYALPPSTSSFAPRPSISPKQPKSKRKQPPPSLGISRSRSVSGDATSYYSSDSHWGGSGHGLGFGLGGLSRSGGRGRGREKGVPSEREVAILRSCALSSVIVLCTICSSAAAVYVFRHPQYFSIVYFTTLTLGLASAFALLLLGAAGGHAHAPLTALLVFAVLSVFLLSLHFVHIGYIGGESGQSGGATGAGESSHA